MTDSINEAVAGVAVVGAGAAGLIAAGTASARGCGCDVLILERNRQPARKLAITGKGRCNLTNTASQEEFMRNLPGNGQFLFSSLAQFSVSDTLDLFSSLGIELKVERGGRVFPVSDDAQEVVTALMRYATAAGARLCPSFRVTSISTSGGGRQSRGNDQFFTVKSESGQLITSRAVIIATGGASYPATGSSGDGYTLAERFGHTIVSPFPALVPLESDTPWVRLAQGLSLRNVSVSLVIDGKTVQTEFGEMLFTHFGVSGPTILTLSRRFIKSEAIAKPYIEIDLKPALSSEQLDERVKRDFAAVSRRLFKNSLDDLLPKKLIGPILLLSNIPCDKPVNQITREERQTLVSLIKGLKISITGTRPISEAIVTAGGVSIKEVNPKTMESRLLPGLFFAGEVLDIDGYTGGFNLQAAWSTGFVAGLGAAVYCANQEYERCSLP